tara:strand:+ start:1841 stop:2716 length:876 start_codon:yes stop_codon:yes gene_type:complete
MSEENEENEEGAENLEVSIEAPEEKVSVNGSDDELDSYSKNVKSRIKKLTEKFRNEERDREEAVRLSQHLIQENQSLKGRVQALDSGYLNEFGSRLSSQTETVKQAYKDAYEAGDSDRLVEATNAMSALQLQQQKYNTAKLHSERQQQQQQRQQQQPQQQQRQQQQQPQPQQKRVDPKAEAWAQKNDWFGEDDIMTNAALTIDAQLLQEEGFDPHSEEYYSEVDKRLRNAFPHKFQKAKRSGGGSQVASAGNSASRSTTQGRRSVRLTHSEVAIARKLNVPLEEYARYKKD